MYEIKIQFPGCPKWFSKLVTDYGDKAWDFMHQYMNYGQPVAIRLYLNGRWFVGICPEGMKVLT